MDGALQLVLLVVVIEHTGPNDTSPWPLTRVELRMALWLNSKSLHWMNSRVLSGTE